MDDVDEIVKEFLAESRDNLDKLDEDFVALERDPGERQILARIFRTIHTIKGTCGFLGYSHLERLTHVGESLLTHLRDGKLKLDGPMTSALLRMVDAVRVMLAAIAATGKDGDIDYVELAAELTVLQCERPTEPDLPRVITEPIPVPPSAAPAASTSAEAAHPAPGEAVADTIRVHVGLLDRLVNLVGELVLSRNQIAQTAADRQDPALLATVQRLGSVTSELQESAMRMRMQPVLGVWSKFPRVARDLALELGKQVVLEMEGQETELDRALIEAIRDPLTHLVRNAVDHGIESPERRLAVGKPAQGRILLRALHENGRVFIEVADDGAGIDPGKIRSAAVGKGVTSPEQAERMSDREALGLIFAPGFSTASAVTRVSGRGVGMDVVRTNIERLGGAVDIVSEIGKGTTMRLSIPLTLAIMPALLVDSGGHIFAIPQSSVSELVRIRDTTSRAALDEVYGASVLRLRGKLLPVVPLHSVLGVQPRDAASDRQGTLVVLQVERRQFGLLVERVHDLQEIVVKPLTPELTGLSVYAGATILGTGRAALILDVAGIAHHSAVLDEQRAAREAERAPVEVRADAAQSQRMLLVRGPDDGRLAIPLDRVARLEEVPASAIEEVGGSHLLQYRGAILPVVSFEDVLEERRGRPRHAEAEAPADDPAQLVVCRHGDLQFGLRVGGIIDILDVSAVPGATRPRRGTLGTTIAKDRVTELVDFDALVRVVRSQHGAAGASP